VCEDLGPPNELEIKSVPRQSLGQDVCQLVANEIRIKVGRNSTKVWFSLSFGSLGPAFNC